MDPLGQIVYQCKHSILVSALHNLEHIVPVVSLLKHIMLNRMYSIEFNVFYWAHCILTHCVFLNTLYYT